MNARTRFFLRLLVVSVSLGFCTFGILSARAENTPSPQDAAQFKYAIQLCSQGAYAKAIPLFQKLSQKYPTKGVYWFNLGNARFELKDYTGAVFSYETVIALESPLAPAARVYIAKAQRRAGLFSRALMTLKSLKGVPLPPALSAELQDEIQEASVQAMKQGLAYYDRHQYAYALAWFNGTIVAGVQGEIREQAVLMRALSLYRLSRFEEAGRTFSYIRQNVRSDSVREKASLLLGDTLARSASKEFSHWFFFDFSTGYDSNIFKDGPSETRVSSPLSQLSLGGGFQYWKKSEFSAAANYTFGWNEDWRDRNGRTLQNLIRLPFNWETESNWFSITPIISYEIAITEPYLMRYGTEFSLSKRLSGHELGLDYSILRKSSLSNQFDYLTGWTHEIRARWGILGKSSYFMPSLTLTRETANDLQTTNGNLPIASVSIGPGLSYTREFGGTKKPWEFGTNAAFIYSLYDHISNPGNIKRRDGLLLLGANLSKFVSDDVKVYGGLTFIRNHSTLKAGHVDDKNFQEAVFLTGVTWELHP